MLTLATTAKMFSTRPSSFIAGLSGYEAYCLDSACALFLAYWEQGKRPAQTPKDGLDMTKVL